MDFPTLVVSGNSNDVTSLSLLLKQGRDQAQLVAWHTDRHVLL